MVLRLKPRVAHLNGYADEVVALSGDESASMLMVLKLKLKVAHINGYADEGFSLYQAMDLQKCY